MGQNEFADQIAQQMKEVTAHLILSNTKHPLLRFQSASTTSAQSAAMNSWAAYAQQWSSANAAAGNGTNGSASSSTPAS